MHGLNKIACLAVASNAAQACAMHIKGGEHEGTQA